MPQAKTRPFNPGPQTQKPSNTDSNVQRPSTVKSGPIEQYIRGKGDRPKLDGLGNVRGCTNC